MYPTRKMEIRDGKTITVNGDLVEQANRGNLLCPLCNVKFGCAKYHICSVINPLSNKISQYETLLDNVKFQLNFEKNKLQILEFGIDEIGMRWNHQLLGDKW